VACGEYGSEVVSKLVEETSYVNNWGAFDELDKQEKGQATSFWTQFSILTKRSLFITYQEKVRVYFMFWAFEILTQFSFFSL
jgi:hypothetical protein